MLLLLLFYLCVFLFSVWLGEIEDDRVVGASPVVELCLYVLLLRGRNSSCSGCDHCAQHGETDVDDE